MFLDELSLMNCHFKTVYSQDFLKVKFCSKLSELQLWSVKLVKISLLKLVQEYKEGKVSIVFYLFLDVQRCQVWIYNTSVVVVGLKYMTTSLQPCQPLIQLRLTRCQAQDHNDTVTTDKMPGARSQCKPAMISEIGKWMVEASSYAKIIPEQQQMALYRRAAVPLDSSTAAGWAPLTTNLTPTSQTHMLQTAAGSLFTFKHHNSSTIRLTLQATAGVPSLTTRTNVRTDC